jgi:hypothetical protein
MPNGDPIFSELCTHISIEDEAGGEYVEVVQQSESTAVKAQTIQLNPEEWPLLKQAVDQLMEDIEKHKK